MKEESWTATKSGVFPPKDQMVWIMDSAGNVQPAQFHNGLWFLGEKGMGEPISMYTYFVPTFWKPRK